MKQIELSGQKGMGKVLFVDDHVAEYLSIYRWHLGNHGYAFRSLPGKQLHNVKILMHRQIMGVPHNMEIDHINGNKLDNRLVNLRIATHAQNMVNIPKVSVTGYRGVRPGKRPGSFYAAIKRDGVFRHLGTFESAESAAAAYNSAASELFGTFARLNDL